MKTEFSFNWVYGKIEDVHKHALELNWSALPIDDILSTFGFVTWNKLCEEAKVKPIFGVTLGVTTEVNKKKTPISNWTFYAIDKIRSINELIGTATTRSYPLITYEEACGTKGIVKIADNRTQLGAMVQENDTYIALNPATPIGLYRDAKAIGYQFVAHIDNRYNLPSDRLTYHTLIKNAEEVVYPQWILSDDEWRANLTYIVTDEEAQDAINNRNRIFDSCNAQLLRADVFKPIDTYSLCEIAIQGAKDLGVDLTDPVYAERFEREIKLIEEKEYSDYFYIVSDLVKYAKQHMIVGPGRGSSAGSLMCYLTGITTIDPIKFGLLFERFIDVTRKDLPDIDLDFSDTKRHLVFDYLGNKYGKNHVAHLGNVLRFKAKSLMNKSGISLGIPKWLTDSVADTLIERSSKDARAQMTFEETFSATELGKKLISEYPEVSIVFGSEDHASHAGSHAAGAIITNENILEYVAIDNRNGTVMCDKDDCEQLNLLKIDILGLSQLSVFERCLELMEEQPRNGFLEKLPLDDKAAFEVLNKRQYSGVFQAMGKSLQILFNMIKTDRIDDLIAITSLSRPGPVASGGAVRWCHKRSGRDRVTYLHPILEPYLSETFGEMIYQEQIMVIARDIGKMGVRDVHHLRKAMSKSMGTVEMNKLGEPFKTGALQSGMPDEIIDKLWGQMIQYGAWCFNKAHAVSYGVVTYYCCWLKAHYPVEFAAATLDAEGEPLRQLYQLRELALEGVEYKAIDPNYSIDKWTIKVENDKKILVGPLTNIHGIGPAAVKQILESRKTGSRVWPSIIAKLNGASTKIDSLTPIRDAIDQLHPDLTKINIYSKPTPIYQLAAGMEERIMIFALIKRIQPRDLNDLQSVTKRGYVLNGQSWVLRLFVNDDTDEILCQIDRHDYLTVGKKIEEIGGQGDALYAIKGDIPATFRMIKITNIRYLGKMSDVMKLKMKSNLFTVVEEPKQLVLPEMRSNLFSNKGE